MKTFTWHIILFSDILQYDTVHGRYPGTVVHEGNKLIVDGKPITITNELDPSKIQWGSYGADYIVESTGKLNMPFSRDWLNLSVL